MKVSPLYCVRSIGPKILNPDEQGNGVKVKIMHDVTWCRRRIVAQDAEGRLVFSPPRGKPAAILIAVLYSYCNTHTHTHTEVASDEGV